MKLKTILLFLIILLCSCGGHRISKESYGEYITGKSYYKPNGLIYIIGGKKYCKIQSIHKDANTAQTRGRLQLIKNLQILKVDIRNTQLVVEDVKLVTGLFQYFVVVEIKELEQ